MDLDPVLLSRIQFAVVVSFHIIFAAFTIGLAAWLAVVLFARRRHDLMPFAMTVLFFVSAFLTLGVMYWPYRVPHQITVADAANAEALLSFLFRGAGVFVLPVIAVYIFGVYWIFRGKVRKTA